MSEARFTRGLCGSISEIHLWTNSNDVNNAIAACGSVSWHRVYGVWRADSDWERVTCEECKKTTRYKDLKPADKKAE